MRGGHEAVRGAGCSRFGPLLCALVVGFCVWAVAPSQADAQVLGAGANFYFDEGEMVGEQRISVQTVDRGFEFANESFVGGYLSLLFPVSDRVRMGMAYRFHGSYDYVNEDRDDDDAEAEEFGWLMDFVYQLDVVLPMTRDLDFLIGGQVGLVLLVPGGTVEDDIDAFQAQGVDVLSGPRLGYVVGPALGMKWNINDMFAVRTDFGIRWQQLLLFATSQTVGNTPFSIDQHANIMRYEVNTGLEVAF